MFIEDVEILSTEEVCEGMWVTWFKAPQLSQGVQPGQFVMIHCHLPVSNQMFARAFSYHDVSGDRFAVLYKVVGQGTSWLSVQKPGTQVSAYGPLGNSFRLPKRKSRLLLVGGGVGIAPLILLAKEARKAGYPVTVLMGTKTSSQLFPESGWEEGVQYLGVTEDGSTPLQGFVTTPLVELLRGVSYVYTCGPNPMYQSFAQTLRAAGKKPKVEILLEENMPCGWGMCYGCGVFTKHGVKLVCKDGPRFDLFEVY